MHSITFIFFVSFSPIAPVPMTEHRKKKKKKKPILATSCLCLCLRNSARQTLTFSRLAALTATVAAPGPIDLPVYHGRGDLDLDLGDGCLSLYQIRI